MRICFLAPINNYHTIKWCEYFISRGHEVHVITFTKGDIDNVNVHYIDCGVNVSDSDTKKIKYLFKYKKVKRLINDINPDIVNAHYATSYGMIASLCNIDYILSIWGSDVYVFPKKSIIHKLYFKYILRKAKYIFSTSNCMKEEISKYTNKDIYVTPFGVKMDLFKPLNNKNDIFTVGTIKSLKEKYGIKYIIDSIEIIHNIRPDINIQVNIAGTGDKEEEYRKYAKEKNVDINWLGYISQEQASIEWNNMDIGLIPSIEDSESFGVSAIEAQSCSIPIIITDIPGLMETTTNESRIIIKRKDSTSLAYAIIDLYDNKDKRINMGIKGREYVLDKYEYNKCFNYIEELFNKLRR